MKGSSYFDLRPYQCHPQWSERKIKPRRHVTTALLSTKRSCEFIDKWWTARHQGAQILFRLPQGAILLIALLRSFGNAIYHPTVPEGRHPEEAEANGWHVVFINASRSALIKIFELTTLVRRGIVVPLSIHVQRFLKKETFLSLSFIE